MDKYEKYILSFFTSLLTGAFMVLFDKKDEFLIWVSILVAACGILSIFYVDSVRQKK